MTTTSRHPAQPPTPAGTPPRGLAAVVIGAGPAGASAAIALARAGWGVTLLEQAAFPRVKVCGEFVSPAATAALESLLPPGELTALGARRVGTLVLTLSSGRAGAAGRSHRWTMPARAWTLSRATLDASLLNAARSAGVSVRSPMRAVRVTGRTGAAQVDLADGSSVEADIVVHADGRGRLDAQPGDAAIARAASHPISHASSPPTGARRGVIGAKTHLRVPGGVDGLRMHSGPGAYFGLVGVERGLATLAMVARADRLPATGPDDAVGRLGNHDRPEPPLDARLDALLASLWPEYDPAWRRDARDADTPGSERWLTCGVARGAYAGSSHPRSFRVGNAAAAVEPVGGEGIGLGLWSGQTLAALLTDAASAARGRVDLPTLTRVHRAYAAAYRRRLGLRRPACRLAAEVLMRPRLCALLEPALAWPGLMLRPWYALTGKPLSSA